MNPEYLDIKDDELGAFILRLENRSLLDSDYSLIAAMVKTIKVLGQAVKEKNHSIHRLLRMIFGQKTESLKKILKDCETESEPDSDHRCKDGASLSRKKGHGRNGAAQYPGAQKTIVLHQRLKCGDTCPLCPKGKVYPLKEPGVIIRLFANPPVTADIYECEKLRCNACGEVFTAEAPESAKGPKYDESVGSMIAILRYGCGFPLNRLDNLQQSLGIPLAASTQWEILENTTDPVKPVFNELIRQAAQGDIVHHDDTPMKILELVKGDAEDKNRSVFTTGFVIMAEERKIALFLTGQQHAGENLEDLLRKRQDGLAPPIQMCDALSRNFTDNFKTLLANCLAHGRRNFVDIYNSFPQDCRYVIETLAKVYRNDAVSKEKAMTADQRLTFHQEKSAPLMEALQIWMQESLDEKKVEPNSGLGKAFNYMLNHWSALTLFLRIPGAPLDNNICERALKLAIRHRKNSLFYKTQHGADIGDLFMSLIHTCNLNGVNPFDYLNTLQRHSPQVSQNPQSWMPWNYKQTETGLPP